MRETGISFRTEGGYDLGVYRTNNRIGSIFFGTDKKWHLSIDARADKVVPTLEHLEMHDIIGMMNSLARTDNYGHPDIRTFRDG
jgi:hypothetical protein